MSEKANDRGTNTPFAALKQIDSGLLNVGYAEDGPANGPAVILLHGWPQNWYVWRLLMPALARDFQVIAVDRRGMGLTDERGSS